MLIPGQTNLMLSIVNLCIDMHNCDIDAYNYNIAVHSRHIMNADHQKTKYHNLLSSAAVGEEFKYCLWHHRQVTESYKASASNCQGNSLSAL